MATAKDRLAESIGARLFGSMGETHQLGGVAVEVVAPPETLEADEAGAYWRRRKLTVRAADFAPPKPGSQVDFDGEKWLVLARGGLGTVYTMEIYRAAS